MNVRCSLANDCHLSCPCKIPHHKTKSCNKYCSLYARARCEPYVARFKIVLPIIDVDPVIDKTIDTYFANKKQPVLKKIKLRNK